MNKNIFKIFIGFLVFSVTSFKTETIMKKRFVLLLNLIFFSSCAALPKSLKVAETPYQKETGRYAVGAAPYYPKKIVRRVYGKNLLKKGVLPVYVVFDNKSEKAISLRTDSFSLLDADGNRWPLISGATVEKEARYSGFLSGIITFPTLFAYNYLIFPSITQNLIVSGAGASGAILGTVYNNKERKKYIDQTMLIADGVPPHSTVSGILYFASEERKTKKIKSIDSFKLLFNANEEKSDSVEIEIPFANKKIEFKGIVLEPWKKGLGLGFHLGYGRFFQDAGLGNSGLQGGYGLELYYDIKKFSPFVDVSLFFKKTDQLLLTGSKGLPAGVTSAKVKQYFYVVDFGTYYFFTEGRISPYIKGGVGFYTLREGVDNTAIDRVGADEDYNFHGMVASGVNFYLSHRNQIYLEPRWDYFNNSEANYGALTGTLGYRFAF